MARSHPGDLTQAVDWMCLWAPRHPLGSPSPAVSGDRRTCRGWDTVLPAGVRGWCGREGRPYRTLPSPAICSLFSRCWLCSLPVVCSSTFQLFAVTTHLSAVLSSGVHKQHPSCAVITDTSSPHPSCHGHLPSCRQLPPSARHNFSPAVCSHHPSYLQFPSPF